MSKYAAGTEVPADRTRAEIERTLTRYGATSFALAQEPQRAMVAFVLRTWQVRLWLPLPDPGDDQFWFTAQGRRRSGSSAAQQHSQEVRRRWRALALILKAKLEASESGIVTFEQEFMAHMVLPDGQTVAEHVMPRIAEAYETGQVPALLPPSRPALPPGER